jgi:hypothetical protein
MVVGCLELTINWLRLTLANGVSFSMVRMRERAECLHPSDRKRLSELINGPTPATLNDDHIGVETETVG